MQNFELYNPVRVIFGAGESKNIAKYTKSLGKRALLVSYENPTFLDGVLSDVKSSLGKSGIDVVEFYRIQANPILAHVREAIEICKKELLREPNFTYLRDVYLPSLQK